ncbi:MAG: NrdH-redoxin [Promethearchaeota archaeon]|nr:MAG: NrdH-redoxin [Candidatus Lokiarchaeota archaeon]
MEGKHNSQDILAFTLSTCMWCKKAKRYLKDNNVEYRYVDVDRIQASQKAQILDYLRNEYEGTRISYPFIICDGNPIVGYSPEKYKEQIKAGE